MVGKNKARNTNLIALVLPFKTEQIIQSEESIAIKPDRITGGRYVSVFIVVRRKEWKKKKL